MIEQFFPQVLFLFGTSVAVLVAFQFLRIPSSLGYLLVGVLLGPYTVGPVVESQPIHALAEIGIVFLLFTIGLNFSIPQIRALRNLVFALGTAQVLLTTIVVGLGVWLMGVSLVSAIVVGAVFAQSSTIIISRQLAEQGEEHSRHGRLGLAMSVFQDVTAVPFVVIIPALGMGAGGAGGLASALGAAAAKALLAFLLVFITGRWVLRPLFHLVAERRSAEVFTLTVLFVSLLAAWTTQSLGMSMPFGAFLAGMMLGETEFRHQIESTIRPFRDVLLGLFFIGIGMLIDLSSLPRIWYWALAGAAALLITKAMLVAVIVRLAQFNWLTAWRTGWLLAVGGEFGFALLAIALADGTIDPRTGQIVLTSVLLSMIAAPFLIQHGDVLARWCARNPDATMDESVPLANIESVGSLRDHVVICGYGRIGQSVANFLDEERIVYVAVDLEPGRVKEAHLAGEPVFYGDASERNILEALGAEKARLILVSHDDVASALKTLHHVRFLWPQLPVMVRTRDESQVKQIRTAGATEIVPETIEASLMIAANTLMLLGIPLHRIVQRIQQQRQERYPLLRELFRSGPELTDDPAELSTERLRPVVLSTDSQCVGQTLGQVVLEGVVITALVRRGKRQLPPSDDIALEPGDTVVLFGSPRALEDAERYLLRPAEKKTEES